jgi:hypothetical protein
MRLINFFIYYYFVFKNRKIDYFNYNKLIQNFPIFSFSNEPGIIGNKCYGNHIAVSNALKDINLNTTSIEHGLYFGKYVIKSESNSNSIDTIVTFSEYRKDALLNSGIINKNIITIGPYIKYINYFKSINDLNIIKKNLRKTLLVFPLHNSDEVEKNYDQNDFINEIFRLKEKHDFNTILISMYWLDIKNKKHLIYQKFGFTIVTAGNRSDPFFLSRLKDLIYLCDMTISNDLGTHVGYCICLNKPHYIYRQYIKINDKIKKVTDNFDSLFYTTYFKEIELFLNLFSSDELRISNEQKSIVKYYWGN